MLASTRRKKAKNRSLGYFCPLTTGGLISVRPGTGKRLAFLPPPRGPRTPAVGQSRVPTGHARHGKLASAGGRVLRAAARGGAWGGLLASPQVLVMGLHRAAASGVAGRRPCPWRWSAVALARWSISLSWGVALPPAGPNNRFTGTFSWIKPYGRPFFLIKCNSVRHNSCLGAREPHIR